MSKALLGYNNIPDRDNSTVSGSGFKSGFPITNLTNAQIGRYAQINGSTATIKVDAGEDVTARVLAFIGTTITSSASYTLKVDPDGGSFGNGNTATRTSFSVDTDYEQLLDDFGADITGRYWQIDLDTGSNSARKIGRLVIPPMKEFYLVHPLEIQVEDRTVSKETEGGQLLRFKKPQSRIISLNYQFIGSTARSSGFSEFLKTIDRLNGKFNDVLVISDPSDADIGLEQMIWGQITKLGSTNLSGYQQVQKNYEIKEVK